MGRAAASGDRLLLRELMGKREKAGTLSNGEAESLARVIAAREVRLAMGESAVRRVHELQPCAHELDDALAERMQVHDAAGACAALERIESGHLDLDWARAMRADPMPEWRAVAARALVRPMDRGTRGSALVDPDPRVRRQAARAARDAADGLDVDALAESARVDPDRMVRTEAVRALAALPRLPGERTAQVLRDLWEAADSPLRQDIARAWASAAVWPEGGRGALEQVVASQHGAEAVEAAIAVLAHHDAPQELADLASSAIAAAIAEGPTVTRLQALSEAPLDRTDVAAAVRAACADDDRAVRIAALGRLAPKDGAAVKELESLARPGEHGGRRARVELALAGDRRVQVWIEDDLDAADGQARLEAVSALAALGVPARGAPLLADDDPSVRARAACILVRAARVTR